MSAIHTARIDSATRVQVLGALALAVLAGASSMRILDPLLPAISHDLGQSVGTTSLAVTFYAMSYGACQLFYGPLGDRLGPYRIICWATISSAGAALLCMLASSLTWLVVCRLLAGGIAAAVGPLALTFVGHMTSAEQRPVIFARMSSASLLGTVVGQMSSGFISEFLDWRMSFVLIAVLFGGAGAVLCWIGGRYPDLNGVGRMRRVDPAARLGFYRLVMRPEVRFVLIMVGVEGLSAYLSLIYAAAMLHRQLGIDLAGAGLIVGLFGVGGIFFAIVAHHVMRRLRASQRALFGSSLAGAGFGLLAVVQGPLQAALCMFCAGFGLCALHNILQVRATTAMPDAPSAVVSLFAATFFMGQALGAALGGWTFDHLAPGVSCGASMILLIAVGVVGSRAERRRESSVLELIRDEPSG